MNVRIFHLHCFRRFRKQAHIVRFPCADINIACYGVLRGSDFICRLFHKVKDFLRALTQHHPFLRQCYLSRTIASANQKLFAQLPLQCFQLCGKRWLGKVQGFRRRRDILLPCHSQKILQHAQFHHAPPSAIFSSIAQFPIVFNDMAF